MSEVVVVELGCGNTASMAFALERLGARVRLSADPAVVAEAPRLILPGVAAAGYAVDQLKALGLIEAITAFPRPLLGACLGQQLLFEASEEGEVATLGLIPGRVRALTGTVDRPVPHMGWSRISRVRDDPLLEGVADGTYVYFVHGYACPVTEATLASARHGEAFAAVVRQDNRWGCQFHPERSQGAGARILANFLDLPC